MFFNKCQVGESQHAGHLPGAGHCGSGTNTSMRGQQGECWPVDGCTASLYVSGPSTHRCARRQAREVGISRGKGEGQGWTTLPRRTVGWLQLILILQGRRQPAASQRAGRHLSQSRQGGSRQRVSQPSVACQTAPHLQPRWHGSASSANIHHSASRTLANALPGMGVADALPVVGLMAAAASSSRCLAVTMPRCWPVAAAPSAKNTGVLLPAPKAVPLRG